MAADVQLLCDLALRLALDPVTVKDLVSFYHSFHFVGSGYFDTYITSIPRLNFPMVAHFSVRIPGALLD